MLLAQVEDERVPEPVADNVVKGVAGLAFEGIYFTFVSKLANPHGFPNSGCRYSELS